MKKIFIYYSLTNNGDFLSSELSKKGYDIRKVIEKKKMPKSFFFRVLIGGFRAGTSQKAKLVNYDNDVSMYEKIVIGSPIWNGRFPPVINSVLKDTDLKKKKLSFLLYSGSGEAPKAIKKISELYPSASIYILKEPKSHPLELEKISTL